MYNQYKNRCELFECLPNSDGTDWNYNWKSRAPNVNDSMGITYARPHSYSPRCHNSYFMRRTWETKKAVKSSCSIVGNLKVQNLYDCMVKSCENNANVFNIISHESNEFDCEMKYCNWHAPNDDYQLSLSVVEDNNANCRSYSLGHTFKTKLILNKTLSSALSLPSRPTPEKCDEIDSYFSSTDQPIPTSLYESGYTSILYVTKHKANLAFKCKSNSEGTDWSYYNQNDICENEEQQDIQWWSLPYPGTPNCKTDIFTRITVGHQCKKSTCNVFKKIDVRDLRQCMISACKEGYNVINYCRDNSTVVCEIRICSKDNSNGDYNFNFSYDPTGFSVYGLYSDATLAALTVDSSEICHNITNETSHDNTEDTCLLEFNPPAELLLIVFLCFSVAIHIVCIVALG
ncbi:unnamed protein product [Owenia fusiformis]|uniref:Uncharacterized protein n=1 Tax=Owenia fusiformis TaxID=6347 RepID=A0A8J1Y144_OWEFU|nr:unnamed protein product [Owenia fusiformis]